MPSALSVYPIVLFLQLHHWIQLTVWSVLNKNCLCTFYLQKMQALNPEEYLLHWTSASELCSNMHYSCISQFMYYLQMRTCLHVWVYAISMYEQLIIYMQHGHMHINNGYLWICKWVLSKIFWSIHIYYRNNSIITVTLFFQNSCKMFWLPFVTKCSFSMMRFQPTSRLICAITWML